MSNNETIYNLNGYSDITNSVSLIYDNDEGTYSIKVNKPIPKGQGVTIPFKLGQNPDNQTIVNILESNEWSITKNSLVMYNITQEDPNKHIQDTRVEFILNDEFKSKRKSESLGNVTINLFTKTVGDDNSIEERITLDLSETEMFINVSFTDSNPISIIFTIDNKYNYSAVEKLRQAGLIIQESTKTDDKDNENNKNKSSVSTVSLKLRYSYAVQDVIDLLHSEIREAVIKRFVI